MDNNLKKMYPGMTKKEAWKEVKKLKKELKPLLHQISLIEDCLEYLNYKVI